MSNCVVRSRGSRLPCSIVADHGIEGGDHLSHDGDDNDFGLLVDRGETVVEDLEGGIVSGCAEGSHVEDVTDRASSRDGGDSVNQPPSTLTMLLSRHTRRREFITLNAHIPRCPTVWA